MAVSVPGMLETRIGFNADPDQVFMVHADSDPLPDPDPGIR
jgi:hypothetical protein